MECGNRLRVVVRAKNAVACRGLRVGPSKAGKKKVYTTTVETLLFFFFRVWGSVVYTLLSGPMVYTLFPCFPRTMVYTIAFLALWPRGRATDRLSGPISRDIAIVSLRYPLSRDTFSAIPAIPQQGAIPPLAAFFYTNTSVRYPILQHIAWYLCDTPGKQARKQFAILSLKVSRDMKSIAVGKALSL